MDISFSLTATPRRLVKIWDFEVEDEAFKAKLVVKQLYSHSSPGVPQSYPRVDSGNRLHEFPFELRRQSSWDVSEVTFRLTPVIDDKPTVMKPPAESVNRDPTIRRLVFKHDGCVIGSVRTPGSLAVEECCCIDSSSASVACEFWRVSQPDPFLSRVVLSIYPSCIGCLNEFVPNPMVKNRSLCKNQSIYDHSSRNEFFYRGPGGHIIGIMVLNATITSYNR